MRDIALHGKYAYLAYQSYVPPGGQPLGLDIVDMSTITSPTSIKITGHPIHIEIHDNYLYTSDEVTLLVYDLSTPDSPTHVKGIVDIKDDDIFIAGNKLYNTDYYNGVDVYDLSNPGNPSKIGNYKASDVMTPFGNIIADGNTAYIAYYSAGLRILDVDTSISEIKQYDFAGYPIDVLSVNGYTYLLNMYKDLYVLDTSDPLNPIEKANYYHYRHFYSMDVVDQYLFLRDQYGIEILDVTDPLSPTFASNYYPIEDIRDMTIHGDFVYLGLDDGYKDSLQIVHIANITNPTKVAALGSSYGHLYGDGEIVGSYFYMNETSWTSHIDPLFHVIDISDPFNPEIKKSLTFTGDLGSLAIIGNYAYLANQEVGVQIVNITDPLDPKVEGVYQMPNSTNEKYSVKNIDGQLVIAAELNDGSFAAYIFDVTNPTSPNKVGEYNHFFAKSYYDSVAIYEGKKINDYTYYITGGNGLLIYGPGGCGDCKYQIFLPSITNN